MPPPILTIILLSSSTTWGGCAGRVRALCYARHAAGGAVTAGIQGVGSRPLQPRCAAELPGDDYLISLLLLLSRSGWLKCRECHFCHSAP
jgi:hypothetical protein